MITECFDVAGVASEGLYRVAGFHDDVEAIKMAFDKGNSSCYVAFSEFSISFSALLKQCPTSLTVVLERCLLPLYSTQLMIV